MRCDKSDTLKWTQTQKGTTAGEKKEMETKKERDIFCYLAFGTENRGKKRKVNLSLSTPRGRIGEWRYNSTHSQPKHQMEMSGSLYAPAALPPCPFRIIQIQTALSTLSSGGTWLTVYPLVRQSTIYGVIGWGV